MRKDLKNQCLKGKYMLQDLIGEGTYSQVYSASVLQDLPIYLDQKVVTVAIKIIYHDNLNKEEITFLEEGIQKHQNINSPYVLKIFEYFKDDHHTYIVSEKCTDNFMNQIQNKSFKGFIERKLRKHYQEFLYGLKEFHSQNILHCGIKLSNIFLDNGICKLGYTGSGRFRESNNKYLAPEVQRDGKFGIESELYSAGVFFYQLIEKIGLQGDSTIIILQNIENMDIQFFNVSEELKYLIKNMLKQKSEERIKWSKLMLNDFFQHMDESDSQFINSSHLDEGIKSNEELYSDSYKQFENQIEPIKIDNRPAFLQFMNPKQNNTKCNLINQNKDQLIDQTNHSRLQYSVINTQNNSQISLHIQNNKIDQDQRISTQSQVKQQPVGNTQLDVSFIYDQNQLIQKDKINPQIRIQLINNSNQNLCDINTPPQFLETQSKVSQNEQNSSQKQPNEINTNQSQTLQQDINSNLINNLKNLFVIENQNNQDNSQNGLLLINNSNQNQCDISNPVQIQETQNKESKNRQSSSEQPNEININQFQTPTPQQNINFNQNSIIKNNLNYNQNNNNLNNSKLNNDPHLDQQNSDQNILTFSYMQEPSENEILRASKIFRDNKEIKEHCDKLIQEIEKKQEAYTYIYCATKSIVNLKTIYSENNVSFFTTISPALLILSHKYNFLRKQLQLENDQYQLLKDNEKIRYELLLKKIKQSSGIDKIFEFAEYQYGREENKIKKIIQIDFLTNINYTITFEKEFHDQLRIILIDMLLDLSNENTYKTLEKFEKKEQITINRLIKKICINLILSFYAGNNDADDDLESKLNANFFTIRREQLEKLIEQIAQKTQIVDLQEQQKELYELQNEFKKRLEEVKVQ